MTSEQWQQVKNLFQAAVEMDAERRRAFLDEACAGDPDLRREVEALLTAHGQAPDFMETPAYEVGAEWLAEQADAVAGRHIGPYQVVREIGRGGMGAVYLAERTDGQFRKQVAIKLVKRGMDTDAVLQRFRHEQQILAELEHPNMARLIDGGVTDDGLSYFIMEHVDGLPIDLYGDQHRLPTVERLQLFRTVCAAAAYAHARGIVHRDIKPSNILVSADGVAKLLDFGIAKVLDAKAAGSTTASAATGLRPMTPEYASPEQVRGEPVTAASDIYSLGVLLYELLTGHRPYGRKTRTPEEIARVICEEAPAKPSTAISRIEETPGHDGTTMTLTPESVSQTRDGEPEKLRRRLAGDLDNIVLMALRKEPGRRYPSVAAFSEDLRRHLEGLPVIARKDTLGYRGAKFIQRNKAAVMAVTFSVVVLLALVIVGFHLYLQRDKALGTAVDSLAILPFVNVNSDHLTITTELIDVVNGSHLWGEQYNRKFPDILSVQEEIAQEITAKLRLRLTGAERQMLAKRDTENPAAYREYFMGRHFWSQRTAAGLKRGLQHFERAIELDPNYALAHAGVADSYVGFATFRVLSPKEAYPKTRAAAIRALELNPALSEAHSALAMMSLYHDWDWAAAERAFQRALALKPDDATARLRYALALPWFERFDEALHEIGQAREADPVSPLLGANTGQILYLARRYDQAIEELRKTLALDPNFWVTHNLLGITYVATGAYDAAIVEFKKAMDLGKSSEAEANLAHAYAVSGQTREAKKILADLIDCSQQTYVSPFDIAVVYVGVGDHDQAFTWLEKAYDERTRPMLSFKVNPRLDPLRSDPRFTDLVRRVGLPP